MYGCRRKTGERLALEGAEEEGARLGEDVAKRTIFIPQAALGGGRGHLLSGDRPFG